jgi:hypothetical protein
MYEKFDILGREFAKKADFLTNIFVFCLVVRAKH